MNSDEGIIWIKFECKQTFFFFFFFFFFTICACYFPPENSTYVCTPHEFFDTLKVNEYQRYGNFYIVGDCNLLCGHVQDYIEGIDEVDSREISDYGRNSYGDMLLLLFVLVYRRFQLSFSHITTVSGCDRMLFAHFYSAASLKYHAQDTWHDTTPSHIILSPNSTQ